MNALAIHAGGEQFLLFAARAVWWEREKTLFIADPHFGKAATFRFHGIPIPEAPHEEDLRRLVRLIHETGAGRLVILGDLFHARRGYDDRARSVVTRIKEECPRLEITLVLGNHDRSTGLPDARLGIGFAREPLLLGSVAACHVPDRVDGYFVLAGHLHPAYRLESEVVPCFHVSEHQMILPAFGSFTGHSRVTRAKGEKVYLAGAGEILLLPPDPPRR